MPGPSPKVSDTEFMREMVLTETPVVTASEMADKLGMSRQNANYRLKSLEKQGYVGRKEVGSRAVVYWVTDEGKEVLFKSDG